MYQRSLARRYSDFPPPEDPTERFGLFYDEIGQQTAQYVRSVVIESDADEREFYRQLRGYPGRFALCCVVQGLTYQAFVKEDFEDYIPRYLALTEEEKFQDAQQYFQYHGLDQSILFSYLESEIVEWKQLHCREALECEIGLKIKSQPYPRPVFYNLGHIPGFDGVQLADDGGVEGEEVLRMRAGSAEMDYDDEYPPSPTYPPPSDDVAHDVEEYEFKIPDPDVRSQVRDVNYLTPLSSVPEDVVKWVEEVKVDLITRRVLQAFLLIPALGSLSQPTECVPAMGKACLRLRWNTSFWGDWCESLM